MTPVRIPEVTISDDSIRLGQFLKLAGLADAGSDAKALIESGEVSVNGRVDTRRGRQLRSGDVVACGDRSARVVTG
ncbi:MAG TPA: RNA-binding S4 domain-containing protein [Pseudonocardiaceae bacterium]|jgi:ribosome-associated protein|nr:RNA-binding S4 domain-containing protein [Pseudonocardiaceae bacterium]